MAPPQPGIRDPRLNFVEGWRRAYIRLYTRTHTFFCACMATCIYCYTHVLLCAMRAHKCGSLNGKIGAKAQQRGDCQKKRASTIFHCWKCSAAHRGCKGVLQRALKNTQRPLVRPGAGRTSPPSCRVSEITARQICRLRSRNLQIVFSLPKSLVPPLCACDPIFGRFYSTECWESRHLSPAWRRRPRLRPARWPPGSHEHYYYIVVWHAHLLPGVPGSEMLFFQAKRWGLLYVLPHGNLVCVNANRPMQLKTTSFCQQSIPAAAARPAVRPQSLRSLNCKWPYFMVVTPTARLKLFPQP